MKDGSATRRARRDGTHPAQAQAREMEPEEAKRRGLDFFKCSTNEEMLQIMELVETE